MSKRTTGRCPADLQVMRLDEFAAEPHATLRALRARDWVVGSVLGRPIVLTHADVRALLSDERLHANIAHTLASLGVSSGAFFQWLSDSPLNHDGAYHRRWRAIMSRTFTPRSVERLRPFLGDAAHGLIDRFAANGACEFVEAFADPYPSLGLCELIGVPAEDRERFRSWANTIGLGFNLLLLPARIAEVDEALSQLLAYTSDLADRRRAKPRDDLVTRIVQAGDEETAAGGEGFTADKVAGSVAGLVFAGHETTRNQLGWMVTVLADRADVWDAVGRGEQDPVAVVDEVLRLRSAVTATSRVAAEPFEHRDLRFETGDEVIMSLWSANHDEAVFRDAEVFDPGTHSSDDHTAFGHGPHYCLGAALARAELQEALRALATRITCPAVGAGAVWKPPIGINGPDVLPLTFSARR